MAWEKYGAASWPGVDESVSRGQGKANDEKKKEDEQKCVQERGSFEVSLQEEEEGEEEEETE